MRPVRVVMRAFGPYADEQVVDFRELGENRFFLIHGPTGSGKTTVLDAMCYALYGVTTGAERSAEEMRSQFACDTLPTEVVFDFAIGQDLYRVRRRPAQERAKARGTGTTTVAAEACLWKRDAGLGDEQDGTPIAVKAREVDAQVEGIVGFSADQFRQVVMLPQGRFRELLSASSKDREKIMQTLFGTGRYAGIERRLKERKREIEEGIADTRKLRDETLRRAGAESDAELVELAEAGVSLRDGALARRDEAGVAAEAAAAALEAGRLAAGRLAAIATSELALAEADAAAAACEAAAASASEALTDEEARESERTAVSESVRALEAVQAATGALESARAMAELARCDHAAKAAALDAAKSAHEDAQQRLKDARATVEGGADAAAELARAEAAFEAAAKAVQAASALADVAGRIVGATKARDAAVEACAAADEAAKAATAGRDDVLLRWREGRAALLAETLVPSEPCPVCGSTDHPAPARSDAATPTDDEVAAAEDAARAALKRATDASARLGTTEAGLAALVAEERTLRAATTVEDAGAAREVLEAATAAREAAAVRAREAAAATAAVATLEESATALAAAVEDARKASDEAGARALLADRDVADAESRVPAHLREPGALTLALAKARGDAAALAAALEEARRRAEAAGAASAGAVALKAERAAALEAARCEAAGVIAPDLEALEAAAREAAAARNAAIEEAARLAETCTALANAQARLAELDAESGDLLAKFETTAAIADAANGANPAKLSFQRYVLGVFLTDVLEAATRRLEVMTRGRYRLHRAAGPKDRRSAAGLDLEVFDEYTGEDRSVATLSGGEGFLASLALALGLAEVVEALAGGVHLDTVFVDEGFGTLDEEALETAIDALMELQGRSRLVGIISHVTELQAVVPARLEVTTSPRGSAARFVVP